MKAIMKQAAGPLCVSLVFLFVYAGGGRQVTAAEQPKRIGATATESMTFQLLDSRGQALGRIHDLLCDLASGYVSFIIFDLKRPDLSRKGYYPVPSDLLNFDPSKSTYIIGTEGFDVFKYDTAIREKFSPGTFMRSDIDFQQISLYWRNVGVMPPPELTKGHSLAQGDDVYTFGFRILPGANVSFRGINGYEVINPNGQRIGEIEDLLFNPFSGEIGCLLVQFDDPAVKHKVYPLPLDAFTLNFSDQTVTFDLPQRLIFSAPALTADELEKATNPDWIDQVRQYWRAASPVAGLRRGMHIVPQTAMRETSLLGTEVTNYQGEFLGRIRDFVISDNGNIPYAITEVDDRWNFIPTTAITIDRFHKLALVDIPKSRLTALASYELGALPDLNISDWDFEIRTFWLSEMTLKPNDMAADLIISEPPQMTPKKTQNFLASALREYTVRGSGGERLGDIEDLMFNMEEADAAYIVIGVGGFLDIGEKLFPIPVKALSIVTGKDVVLDINRKMLSQAPGFPSNEWLIMESPEQRKAVSNYWRHILG